MGELITLLNTQSGIFFHQLTVLLVVFGGIIVVLGRKRETNANLANRLLRGLYALLILRFGLTATALAISSGTVNPITLDWVERGLTTATWIIIVWLWAFPDRSNTSDLGTALLTIFSITLTFLTVGLLLQQSALAAWVSLAWSGFSILVLLSGILLLLVKKPDLWGYGFSMLFLLLTAEIGTFIFTSDSGAALSLIRLAAIASFPVLLTLPQRIDIERIVEPEPRLIARRSPERKRVNLPASVFGNFLALATETDMLKISRGVTETVSFAMVADICLMVSRPTQQDEIIIYCGYDQVLEQEIMGAQIASKHLPMIASAIQKHAPLRLPASSASSDLKFLSSALHLPKSGHLLVAPIRTASNLGVGALILLTPYSSRTWTQDDQTYLSLAAERVGHLLEQSQNMAGMEREIETLRAKMTEAGAAARRVEADTASFTEKYGQAEGLETPLENTELLRALEEAAFRQQELESEIEELRENNDRILGELADESWNQTIQHLQAENIQLQLAVHELESGHDDLKAKTENYKTAHKESLLLVEQLHEENERLRKELEQLSEQRSAAAISPNGQSDDSTKSYSEIEFTEALREIARLQNIVGEAEIKILELSNLSESNSNTTRQWEMIIMLAEEMRQPMSSILGYSDFLLTESVGLLGTLQRKFLERVKASTNRMSAMVEDLIHIAASESGKLKLKIGQVDLTSVVDSAIASSTVQMREKTISLLVNLPENLPIIEGDREAIRLTLIHLLHNAAAASPLHGKITIEIEFGPEEEDRQYIQILVSDSGGGIHPDDLTKVFERRFKSRDELIKGLGVSSSGLSIAKTLIEAHGGRVWVENRTEEGATFCILLPMTQEETTLSFGTRSIE